MLMGHEEMSEICMCLYEIQENMNIFILDSILFHLICMVIKTGQIS